MDRLRAGEVEELEPLALWLEHPNAELHGKVTQALVKMGISEAVRARALASRFGHHDPAVRHRAAAALAAMGVEAAEPYAAVLAESLVGHSDAVTRRTAAEILGHLGHAAAPQERALIKALQDPEKDVQLAAARALGQLGADVADFHAQHLAAVVTQHRDLESRAVAAELLGQMGEGGQAHCVHLADQCLNGPSASVREAAAKALAQMGTTSSQHVREMAERLKRNDASPLMRKRVLDAFATMGASASPHAETVATFVFDSDAGVRMQAARALGAMGSIVEPIAGRLAALLNANDEEQNLPRKAAAALGLMGAVGAAALERRADDEDVGVRTIVRLTLRSMKERDLACKT